MSARASAAGTPYHRLAHLRESWSLWWRPLLTIGVALLAYVVLASILLVTVVSTLALLPGADSALGMSLGDPASPLDVAVALLMGALWWPSALIAVRFGGWRPVRWLIGVTGSFRHDLVRAAALPVASAALLGTLLVTALTLLVGPGGAAPEPAPAGQAFAAAVLAVVLGVLKAIGAELALRGVAMQAIGTWVRSPALTVLLATALALPAANLTAPGLLIAVLMGLACGYLAWRSGGLELSILLSVSLTVSGGLVAAIGRALPGMAGEAGAAGAALGRTASGAAGVPGVATGSVLGAVGIGVLALLIAAGLSVRIGRCEGLAAGAAVVRSAEEPEPRALAV